MDSDTRRLVKLARRQGCTIVMGGKHPHIITQAGIKIPFAGSRSDKGRGLKNMRADLRRAGLKV